jgi:urocanate hydratase
MRHADAGYPEALACAAEHGLQLPMIPTTRTRGAAQ